LFITFPGSLFSVCGHILRVKRHSTVSSDVVSTSPANTAASPYTAMNDRAALIARNFEVLTRDI
jgi:hypothetical protein